MADHVCPPSKGPLIKEEKLLILPCSGASRRLPLSQGESTFLSHHLHLTEAHQKGLRTSRKLNMLRNDVVMLHVEAEVIVCKRKDQLVELPGHKQTRAGRELEG